MLYHIFLFALCWVGAGILISILKMFLLFRGPSNMMVWYIIHPITRKTGMGLYRATHAIEKANRGFYIAFGQLVYSVILPPVALVETLGLAIIFMLYTPPKNILEHLNTIFGEESNEQK